MGKKIRLEGDEKISWFKFRRTQPALKQSFNII